MKEKRTDNLNMRCSPEFKKRLIEFAEKDGRTYSSLVIHIMTKYMDGELK